MNKSRCRVFIIDGSIAVTGAFMSAREMATVLRGEMEVALALPCDSTIEDNSLSDFSTIYRLPIKSLRRSIRDVLLYLPYLLIASVKLRLLLRKFGADALLVNDFYLVHGALIRLMGYRGKIITWVRIDPTAFGMVSQLWLWAAGRASDHIVAVSHFIQSLLSPSLKSTVIYDAVGSDFLPEPPPAAASGRVFTYLGNYIQGKGQDVAIEALAKVLQVCPDVKIEFYGGDMGLEKNRAYLRSLQQCSVGLGLQDSVSFGDFSSVPRSVMIGKFGALNLSRSESFSRTVLEASACGLPLVATRCGGPEEIIENGETGFLVAVGDIESCAKAIIALCTTPGLSDRMGAAGRRLVLKKFGPEKFRTRLEGLLKNYV